MLPTAGSPPPAVGPPITDIKETEGVTVVGPGLEPTPPPVATPSRTAENRGPGREIGPNLSSPRFARSGSEVQEAEERTPRPISPLAADIIRTVVPLDRPRPPPADTDVKPTDVPGRLESTELKELRPVTLRSARNALRVRTTLLVTLEVAQLPAEVTPGSTVAAIAVRQCPRLLIAPIGSACAVETEPAIAPPPVGPSLSRLFRL